MTPVARVRGHSTVWRRDQRASVPSKWPDHGARRCARDTQRRTRRSSCLDGGTDVTAYYLMFGHPERRRWEDARRYSFVSAGGGRRWSQPLRRLDEGDDVFVHLPGAGYVGHGVVLSPMPRSRPSPCASTGMTSRCSTCRWTHLASVTTSTTGTCASTSCPCSGGARSPSVRRTGGQVCSTRGRRCGRSRTPKACASSSRISDGGSGFRVARLLATTAARPSRRSHASVSGVCRSRRRTAKRASLAARVPPG